MFFTFEATEGAGKSTQARLLADALRALGHEVILTREPGGCPAAEALRHVLVSGDPDSLDAMAELLVFNAARRMHLVEVILPALAAGKIVICDRYLGSTLALQCAGGMDPETVLHLHQLACFDKMPDATFFLDMPVERALARSLARLSSEDSAENRFERKALAFHREAARNFRHQAADHGWIRIDADRPVEAVHHDILEAALALLSGTLPATARRREAPGKPLPERHRSA